MHAAAGGILSAQLDGDRKMKPTEIQTPESTITSTDAGTIVILGPTGRDHDSLVGHLTAAGHACHSAAMPQGHEAIDACEPDIIAISANGQSTGLRLLREAQQDRPWLRAIVFGGTPSPSVVVEAIRDGSSDWIDPTADRGRIEERIQQILSRVKAHRNREDQLEELSDTCRKLSEARDEMSDQVDVLCSDLASAYRSMRAQMTDVAMLSEFKALVSQELDVEDMLRTSLEYILKKIGPTNAVVYLREGDDQYGVGAYVNYQWQDMDVTPMLRTLGDVVCNPMSRERELIRFEDANEFADQHGEHMNILHDAEVIAFSAHSGEECLGVFVLFRDAETGFNETHAATLESLRKAIEEQLSQIVRVHKRARPEWPDEPADDGWNLAA